MNCTHSGSMPSCCGIQLIYIYIYIPDKGNVFLYLFHGKVDIWDATEIEAQNLVRAEHPWGLLGPSGPGGNAETLKGCLMPRGSDRPVGTTLQGRVESAVSTEYEEGWRQEWNNRQSCWECVRSREWLRCWEGREEAQWKEHHKGTEVTKWHLTGAPTWGEFRLY